ncbi:MAG: DUF1697 domain-containing protein [Aquabacterium sp.]|uniref:DUF1697 domain-containing protein n=1 Tax=Aquabacterium sp. TaxID=1872578 RepID=UPI002A364A09|nr:DUF1697 domain-containing protein [Aquabacterium sp.]MDX9844944.1 DUF1697 domain-containing protein [Aquabacterium sp.]
MTRYVAFLRGVSPMNCKMLDLKRCFEAAGFTDVKTVLSSGNVAFTAQAAVVPILESAAEAQMPEHLGRVFQTIVRPSVFLQSLVATDPFAEFALPANAKRIVTFLRRPCEKQVVLPIERGHARILKLQDTEVFSAYVPNETGPVFMALLERTFGAEVTTRTLETVRKCSQA